MGTTSWAVDVMLHDEVALNCLFENMTVSLVRKHTFKYLHL